MENKIYLVDFFDTIMFRHIHPFQLLDRWAINIKNKYKLESSTQEILKLRKNCFAELTDLEKKDYYSSAIKNMYEQLIKKEDNLEIKVTKEEFTNFSRESECALEYAVQYPNKKLINKLKKEKQKGTKIYIVSDFHLGENELKNFLKIQNIDFNLFDKIFVSSDCGAEKADGSFYKYIIEKLKFSPEHAIMIGDNFNSDKKQAEKYRIKTIYKMRFLHKVNIHIKMKFLKNRANYIYIYICGKFIKDCYKYRQPFSEYIVLFHSFIERLYDKNNGNKITFLAREGYFLKELFELYAKFHCQKNKLPKTAYFLCSRMAITSVQIDKIENNGKNIENMDVHNYLISAGICEKKEEQIIKKYNLKSDTFISEEIIKLLHNDIEEQVLLNRKAFEKYAKKLFSPNECNNIVDIGWKGTMQFGLQNVLKYNFRGFYLGVESENKQDYPIEKYGLLFSNKKQSFPYYEILKTNRQLYELLSAAPHGATQTYIMNNDTSEATVSLLWAENEKNLYEQVIKNWQENAKKLFVGFSLWSNHEDWDRANKRNAKIVLKSALFADKDRLSFLHKLDSGFFSNFSKQVAGIKYNPKKVKINLSFIYAPERYVRYIAKVQRMLHNKKIIQLFYKLFAHAFYIYVLLILSIKKNIFRKQK